MSTRADTVVRFSLRTRIEHVSVMGLFLALAVTGFPQKFYPAPWTRWFVDTLGGIDAVRWLHRASGVLFAVLFVVHVAGAVWPTLRRRAALSLVPDAKDFRDAAATLRYQLGTGPHPPAFDRFDYRQKFEYWGLLLGGSVMVATGFLLLFPLLATAFLGGQFVPAAKVAHSNEGLMAFLVVLIWHIFNAHLSPKPSRAIPPSSRAASTGNASATSTRSSTRGSRPARPLRLSRAGRSGRSVTAPVRGALLVMYLPTLGFAMVGLHLGRRLVSRSRRLRGRPKTSDEAKTGEPPASAA